VVATCGICIPLPNKNKIAARHQAQPGTLE
jgi:hypothetical protein